MEWIWTVSLAVVGLLVYAANLAEKAIEPEKKPKRHPLQDVADMQAKEAIRRSERAGDDLSWWVAAFVKRLLQIWPDYPADQAARDAREYLDEMTPRDDYVWTVASAIETAEEHANEYGESYGSNS